jgi:hypothetical protein
VGPLVKRRILLGALALGAFIVTLVFSSWHAGLWHTAAEPPAGAAPQPNQGGVVPAGSVAASASDSQTQALTSTPPAVAAAPAAAMNPPPAAAPAEASPGDSQYEQIANPGVDAEAMRRDRGVQHSSGPH